MTTKNVNIKTTKEKIAYFTDKTIKVFRFYYDN